VARDSGVPAKTRLDALAAVPGGLDAVDSATFEFLLTSVAPSNAVPVRSSAARVLAKARLTEAQLAALAERLKSVGPMEIGPLLGAFDASRDESLGLKLIDALQAAPAVAGLHPDFVRPHFTNFPPAVQVRANELIASLNANAAQQQAHLETLLASLKGGDVRRGQAVFNSEKAACASCHAIGYLGGDIGPDLTRIGQIRTERDLLEAVVYPSASFVRSYEPVIVVTRSGDDYSGVLRKDAPDEVVLATGPGTEVRVARADIVEMRPGTVSVMPQGLDQQLTTQELADLIAFLKATRW
jgi:putative heme-binding domain-containing protein